MLVKTWTFVRENEWTLNVYVSSLTSKSRPLNIFVSGLALSSTLTVIFCGSSQWNLNQPPIMVFQSDHEPRPLSRPAVPTYWFDWVTSGTMRVATLDCETLPAFSVSRWSYVAWL